MHWQPVSISVGGNSESLSEHSSRCSSQVPSPVSERKFSNGIRMSNLKLNDQPDDSIKKGRHVIIRTDSVSSASSAVVVFEDSKTPLLLHEFKSAGLQTLNKSRPTSLRILRNEKSASVSRNRSKSIDASRNNKKSDKNLEKLQRFKEKLLHSSPDLNEASDNESTPLVSDVSSPSKSAQISPEIKSSSLSPISQKSLSPEMKNRQTRSELNLTDTTDVSPALSLHDNVFSISQNSGANSLSPKVAAILSRTMSEANSLAGVVSSLSSASIHSKFSQSSGHLARQNALEETFDDSYCDPNNRET